METLDLHGITIGLNRVNDSKDFYTIILNDKASV